VVIRIPDSLLKDNTTYRVALGKAIQDLHENNPFTGYSYIFSTGDFFDSVQLNGMIFNAATGQRDTGALVLLYDIDKSDSVVLREKPLYAVKADAAGNFTFQGLPDRHFRIYALRDANNNKVYDGTSEMVAFSDSIAIPSNVNVAPIRLNMFTEEDSLGNTPEPETTRVRGKQRDDADDREPLDFTYSVQVDTSDLRKRSLDITKPLEVKFSNPVDSFNLNRLNLSYDSLGISVETSVQRMEDTSKKSSILLNASWLENTVYTLRLLKGFAQDSSGTDAMPGRFSFRTKMEDDYAKLHIHLPSKYFGTGYVFEVFSGDDIIYHQPVTDTMVHLTRLQPGIYNMRVIIDRNRNGKWDTGDLLDRRQPEEVIPYSNTINLKAGWDNTLDFEQRVRGTTSGKRDSSK
jgi:hypothetical protein